MTQLPKNGTYALAPRRSPKGRLATGRAFARRVPGAAASHRAAHRVTTELRMLVHGLHAQRRLRRDPDAESRFAAQTVVRYEAPLARAADRGGMVRLLDLFGLDHRDLTAAILVPAQSGLARALGSAADAYPPGTSFLVGDAGDDPSSSEWRERLLAGALLHGEGLGTRVYDVAELRHRDRRVPVLAIADTGEDRAGDTGRERVASAIRALARDGLLLPTDANWHDPLNFSRVGPDGAVFVRPDLVRSSSQQVLLRRALDPNVQEQLHFGLESSLRGGRYLYQSVPAARQAGRRDSSRRWTRIRELLSTEDVSVEGRVVLDIGCNAGVMLAAALADGARWGLGWDRPAIAGHARGLLAALGCTRTDIFGGELAPDYGLIEQVPSHLRPCLDDSVVFYLAIRHHIGFLEDLGSLPWRVMVYEGGESESVARLPEALEDLGRLCNFRVAAAVDFRDSESLARPLAILVRE